MRKFKRIVVRTIVIGSVVGITWRIIFPVPIPKKTTEPDGQLDIKLIAIRPDMGDICYDTKGRKLEGVTFPLMPLQKTLWDKDDYCLDFIFEIPSDKEILLPLYFIDIITNDKERSLRRRVYRPLYRRVTHKGKKQLIVHCNFAGYDWNKILWVKTKTTFSNIDVRLDYCDIQRQDDIVEFKGPLERGALLKQVNGKSYLSIHKREIKQPYGAYECINKEFRVNSKSNESFREILIYDKSDRPHIVTEQHNYFYLSGITRSEIKSVVGGKKDSTKIFKNVSLKFRGHKRKTSPVFIYEMAERLKIDRMDLLIIGKYKYPNWQEALKVLDIARGRVLFRPCRCIFSDKDFDYDKLDEKTKAYIRNVLIDKIGTPDQVYVTALAVACNIEEYIDIALNVFEIGCFLFCNSYYEGAYYICDDLSDIFDVFKKHQIVMNEAQIKRANEIYHNTTDMHIKDALEKYIQE